MKRMIIALFLFFPLCGFSQIAVRYAYGKRPYYQRGDTVRLIVAMKLNPKSCLDGMRKTYVYFSECEEVTRRPWKASPNGIFVKDMLIRVIGKSKNKAKITITRDTDKESLFRQEVINLK